MNPRSISRITALRQHPDALAPVQGTPALARGPRVDRLVVSHELTDLLDRLEEQLDIIGGRFGAHWLETGPLRDFDR